MGVCWCVAGSQQGGMPVFCPMPLLARGVDVYFHGMEGKLGAAVFGWSEYPYYTPDSTQHTLGAGRISVLLFLDNRDGASTPSNVSYGQVSAKSSPIG